MNSIRVSLIFSRQPTRKSNLSNEEEVMGFWLLIFICSFVSAVIAVIIAWLILLVLLTPR